MTAEVAKISIKISCQSRYNWNHLQYNLIWLWPSDKNGGTISETTGHGRTKASWLCLLYRKTRESIKSIFVVACEAKRLHTSFLNQMSDYCGGCATIYEASKGNDSTCQWIRSLTRCNAVRNLWQITADCQTLGEGSDVFQPHLMMNQTTAMLLVCTKMMQFTSKRKS